ncbi:MAG: rod-binding protein [bacterium]|nr:rod-binding protein [bacterium]
MIDPTGMGAVGRLEALLGPGQGGTGRARDAQAAARELGTVFLTQLIGALRKTVPDAGLFPRSEARTVFEGAFDRTMAEVLGEGDPFGLVKAMAPPGAGLKVSGPSADSSGGQPLPTSAEEGPEP